MSESKNTMITRRAALSASTLATACLLSSTARLARESLARQDGEKPGEPSAFERFCGEWLDIAEDYPDRDPAEFSADAYLYRLCSAVSKLDVEHIPPRFKTGWNKDGLAAGPVWGKGAIFIVEQQLAPGAVLRAHNHPSFNAVTMVSKGDCYFRHFEPIGEAPSYRDELRKPFRLSETRAGILSVGRMSTLSRSRENIHWFQAGDDGATVIDFSMGFGGSSGDFSVLEFDPDPVDSVQRIYEGHWIGNPYRSK